MTERTYFGLEIVDGRFVRQSDIRKLPFYEFWEESALLSTYLKRPDGEGLIYLYDWEAFCRLFIREGKHRYQS